MHLSMNIGILPYRNRRGLQRYVYTDAFPATNLASSAGTFFSGIVCPILPFWLYRKCPAGKWKYLHIVWLWGAASVAPSMQPVPPPSAGVASSGSCASFSHRALASCSSMITAGSLLVTAPHLLRGTFSALHPAITSNDKHMPESEQVGEMPYISAGFQPGPDTLKFSCMQ